MVGDTTADVMCASLAELGLSVGVLSGAGTLAELQPHSHVVLRDVRDALGVLLSARASARPAQPLGEAAVQAPRPPQKVAATCAGLP